MMESSRPLMSKTQNICLVMLWLLFILLGVIMVREIRNKKKEAELQEYQEISLDEEKLTVVFNGWLNSDLLPDSLKTKMFAENFSSSKMTLAEKSIIALVKEQLLPNCGEKSYKLSFNKWQEILTKYFDINPLSRPDFTNLEKDDDLKQVIKINLNEDNLEIANACNKSTKKFLIKYLQAYQNTTNLKVDLKVAFRVENENQGEKFFNYYEDFLTHNIKEKLYLLDEDKINWDNYATYEFLFKVQDNNYFLEEVRKL